VFIYCEGGVLTGPIHGFRHGDILVGRGKQSLNVIACVSGVFERGRATTIDRRNTSFESKEKRKWLKSPLLTKKERLYSRPSTPPAAPSLAIIRARNFYHRGR
jgi:hypothetical protein